uniref:Uncharacterized protein n=1 Tax=Candidatus Kentrum sp. FM TaxID=2126340 RepID=A0A450W4E2_9GAMM|nr:MAG: protein of unknown function (DUF4469) with IG-like fold [Candidatus Kentron sp. FM]VFJ59998.1 MAG: protein of unknown function (DUF4469) with IG-like fold [Candidatus Kentron sp. FM]VFK11913.1 MAG: protein of unknown function (DUF4469) with IG-like fold [Candidatus Kentron sp. FM]
MSIQYALSQNNLTDSPNDYAARVRITGSANLDAIVERILEQGSTVGEADVRAVLVGAIAACESLLLEGQRVNFGDLCQLFPRMSGVFEGPTDHFDPARHRLDVGASPGNRLRKTVRENGQVTKVEFVKPVPTPLEYLDLGSGETDGALTPGNIGTVNGYRLKFDAAQADEGVFLIADGGEETKVAQAQKNKPAQLVFLVPAGLLAGDYALEVRTRVKDSGELRTGRLDATLTV